MNIHFKKRSLDEWYKTVNRIYLDRNFHRDRFAIFAHIVEILGGLSLLSSSKSKPDVTPRLFVPKAIAWWMALCGKVGIKSIEDMLWQKFPGVCSYCHLAPHQNDECIEKKSKDRLNWKQLSLIGQQNNNHRPHTLIEWQVMFSNIYPITGTEEYPATIARFTEELGELAEALRVAPVAPGYFLSEAADVFAWLMHLQNLIHSKEKMSSTERGEQLTCAFAESYPDKCKDCYNPVCTCPPILPGTLGRIANEIPIWDDAFAQGGAILREDEAKELFEIGVNVIKLGKKDLKADFNLIREIHSTVKELKVFSIKDEKVSKAHSIELSEAISYIEKLASAQRLTQESIDNLVQAIGKLPSESRSTLINFISGIGSSSWSTALIEAVKLSMG